MSSASDVHINFETLYLIVGHNERLFDYLHSFVEVTIIKKVGEVKVVVNISLIFVFSAINK